MLSMTGIIALSIVFVGILYIILGFIAYSDRVPSSSKFEAAGPWWALYPRNYNERGKLLTVWGKVFLSLALLVNIYFFING